MKKLHILFLSMIMLGLLVLSGCDLAQPLHKGGEVKPVVQEDALPENEIPENVPQAEVLPNPQQIEDNTVTVRAEAGMSGKGNYGTPTGYNPMEIITVPISTMFQTSDRLTLMSISHAMNLYNAEHGRRPASHAEFMDNIVRANNIKLPQLPPNHEYWYDPRDGELKIRKPRNAP